MPLVTADLTAAVAEGADSPLSDPTLSEITVVPRKVAGLTVVFREAGERLEPRGGERRRGTTSAPNHAASAFAGDVAGQAARRPHEPVLTGAAALPATRTELPQRSSS